MPTIEQSFWGKLRCEVGNRTTPVTQPEVYKYNTAITKPRKIQNFKIPHIRPSEIGEDLSLTKPSIILIPSELLKGLTTAVINVPLLVPVAVQGEYYSQPKDRQESLFDQKLKQAGECIHQLPKRQCSVCRAKEEKRAEEEEGEIIDVFDIIFPILQPPPNSGAVVDVVLQGDKSLYDFQPEGIHALVENESFLLADEMGLGKSIQTIVALKILFHKGKISRALIVCPRSVLTDWERKLWDWAPELSIIRIDGTPETRKRNWVTRYHIALITYGTLRQDIELAREEDFDVIILDEGQKIKNRQTKTAKTVKSLQAKRRWVLTGTPIENSIDDLVSIFEFVEPDLMNTQNPPSQYQASRMIKPFMLRRKKEDVLDELPEKKVFEEWVELSPGQRERYDQAENEGTIYLEELGEEVSVVHVLRLIQELKKICNFDPVTQESSKVEILKDNLESIADQGDKALVFSQYPNLAFGKLEEAFRKFSPLRYYGNLSQLERDLIVDTFQDKENHENKVLLISRAGETGITLTAANYVYFFDNWWNPAAGNQLADRTHRIGQEKTVFVYKLFCKDTYEERIYDLLKKKQTLFDAVVGDVTSRKKIDEMLTEEELLGVFGVKKKSLQQKRQVQALSFPKDPSEFERYVAQVYENMGYRTKVTRTVSDEGVDIYAKRTLESRPEEILIQCKHYPENKVGPATVRDLYGVLMSKPRFDQAHLVTSGVFTKAAKDFAEDKRIHLVDGAQLRHLVQTQAESSEE